MSEPAPWPSEERARRLAEADARRPAASRRALLVAWAVDVALVLLAGLVQDVAGFAGAALGWVGIAALLAPRQFRTGALPPRYTEAYLQMWVLWAATHVAFLAIAVPRFTGLPEWIVPLAVLVPAPLVWAWWRLRRRRR